MIRIDQFINVIHSAVLSANDALMQENLKLLETYFEDSGEADEIETSLNNAIESIDEAINQGKPSKEAIQKVRKAFTEVREALQGEGKQKGAAKFPTSLSAKTVALQFPDQSGDGIIMRNVQVPLITLIPVSMAKVSEVKFKTNLEIQVENDNLMIGFPPSGGATGQAETGEPGAPAGAFIEMTITPQESSEGLKKLIEGYEKILRCQIPN